MTEADGALGWVVVIAAFCSHCITYGIVYSFGILLSALEKNYNGTKAEIAWIPSLTTGFLHTSGLLASVLVNRFGCRVVCIVGAFLCSVGYVLSIFAPNIYYLYITMGVLAGTGFGMVFLPTVLIVTQYFNKYRSVACGIALSGCGIGAFILSPATEAMLDSYSLKGTLLLLSAVILNCIPCSLVFRPFMNENLDCKQTEMKNLKCETELHRLLADGELNKEKIAEDGIKMERNCDEKFSSKCLRSNEGNVLIDYEIQLKEPSDEWRNVNVMGDLDCKENFREENRSPEKAGVRFILRKYFRLLKRPKILLVFLAQFHFIFGFYFPFVFIPDKARGLGISEKISAWVISTIGMSSICGRIILGCFADKPSVNRLLMFKICLLISGISTALNPLFNNIWLMLIYAVIFGASTGFTISVTSVILLDLVGLEHLTDAVGLVSLFQGIGSLLGPSVAGLLYDMTGSYTVPFLTAGASLTFSSLLMFLTATVR